jgi:hypothetical protein
MKLNLVSFSPDSFDSVSRTGIPKLHIRSGRFNISKTAKEITGLDLGDKVMMHQDQDEPSTWYLSKETNGFEIKKAKNGVALAFYSNHLMQTILECFQEEKALTLRMDSDPVKFQNKDFWKFSPMASDDAEDETIEEEASEAPTTSTDKQQNKKKTGGRKKGSKNKPKQPLFI